MRTSRILLFAYHFPPENVIGAARPFRFYKYLPKYGYKCHAVTAADVRSLPDLNADYVPDPFLEGSGKGLGFQIERTVRKLLLPGAVGIEWSHRAFKAGMRYIENHADDNFTVLSTFPPIGAHLAAARLTFRSGIPWVADFRDPMAFNPVNDRLSVHTRWIYRWLERQIVHAAGCVLANTDSAEGLLQTKHPGAREKVHLLWNGFDPDQRITALPVSSPEVRVYTHAGELYEGRSIVSILLAIQSLIDNGRLSPAAIRIQLIGPVEERCLPEAAFVKAAQANGWLTITPHQIPRTEAQQIVRTSTGLLIIQPQSAIQVPGKIFDYVQIGRPILAFVPKDSAIERLLARTGIPFRCIYVNEQAESIQAALQEFFTLPDMPVSPNAWFEETFNAQKQTAYLADLIARLPRR